MAEPHPPSHRRSLERLARAMRGSIGNLRAAAETLELHPGAARERRARLLAVLAEESERLAHQVETLEELAAQGVRAGRTTSPSTLAGLLTGLAGTARDAGLDCAVEELAPPLAGGIDLACDLEPIVAAAGSLVAELRRDLAVAACRLRARAVDHYLLVDLAWSVEPADLQRLYDWHSASLEANATPDGSGSGGGLRAAARELDGEAWFNLDRDGGGACVRILLPAPVPVTASVE